jgi:hypothetical protein
MIILLDLNYTLVENSTEKQKPFTKQIEAERYRMWLVELLRPHHVILMTARPEKYHAATIDSIEEKTGWQPDEALFNTHGLTPPMAKERMLKEHVLPKYDEVQFLAIESNPATRAMYARYGIRSVKIEPGEEWQSLPS